MSTRYNAPFASSHGLRFRGHGFSGVANAGQETSIDFAMPENRYMNGANLILKNQQLGDYVKFQVIDKNNILGYGTNVVLDEFATNWFVSEENSQGEILIPYPAKVLSGLFVRIIYKSFGNLNVSVFCNLFLHKEPT